MIEDNIKSEIEFLQDEVNILIKKVNNYNALYLKHKGALEHTQGMLDARTKELETSNKKTMIIDER